MPEDQQPQDGSSQQQTPPWGSDDDFKPDKAWSLIQNLRGDLDKAKARPVLTDEQQQKLTQWDALEQASKTDLERQQQETARWQDDAQRWRGTAVQSRVLALAGEFTDPTDASSIATDPAKYLGADGQINDEAIKADLAALLEQKPHWRRPDAAAAPRTPVPNRSQGALGGTSTDPGQQFAAVINQALSRG